MKYLYLSSSIDNINQKIFKGSLKTVKFYKLEVLTLPTQKVADPCLRLFCLFMLVWQLTTTESVFYKFNLKLRSSYQLFIDAIFTAHEICKINF